MKINELYLGETLDVLKSYPSESIDLIITSPPYNTKIKYSKSQQIPEEQYQQNQIEVLNQLFRVCKSSGSLFYNHKIRRRKGKLLFPIEWIRKSKWFIWQEIIWFRKIGKQINPFEFWPVDERIYWLKKKIENPYWRMETKHAKLSSVWEIRPETNSPHPAAFPISLPTRIIISMVNKKYLILDPYCGSGTTLVAAKILGHDFLGIDNSPEYLLLAKQRLINYRREIDQVKQELEKHQVKINAKRKLYTTKRLTEFGRCL